MSVTDEQVEKAGLAYVLASVAGPPIPPNGFHYEGMRAALETLTGGLTIGQAFGPNYSNPEKGATR